MSRLRERIERAQKIAGGQTSAPEPGVQLKNNTQEDLYQNTDLEKTNQVFKQFYDTNQRKPTIEEATQLYRESGISADTDLKIPTRDEIEKSNLTPRDKNVLQGVITAINAIAEEGDEIDQEYASLLYQSVTTPNTRRVLKNLQSLSAPTVYPERNLRPTVEQDIRKSCCKKSKPMQII